MQRRRGISVLLLPVVALLFAAQAWAQDPSAKTAAGAYRGKVRCVGSDRFSNGAAARHYRSSPVASVMFDSNQRVTRWTYFFLLRHDLVKRTRAVRRGQSFTYAAGRHIARPGRTRVTITDVMRRPGEVLITARLEWSSPSTHYTGSGTYALLLERVSARTIRYEAVKVVVKQPLTARSNIHPVIRRNELCVGLLTR